MNPTDKLSVISILDSVLGSGENVQSKRGMERNHHCPFCHHPKRKLQINIETQNYHCWVCDAKGTKLKFLLNRLDVDSRTLSTIQKIYKDVWVTTKEDEEQARILLPKEFKQFITKPTGVDPVRKNALHYLLNERGLSVYDIAKYNIGYCDEGLYKNRIIIPSYKPNGELNYFVTRGFYDDMGYKNPSVSKNIIMFENTINWKLPITLCEGVFDAVSIKRNSIPLLGKFISKSLMEAILTNDVTEIIIMLDEDAQEQALYYSNYFLSQGIPVKNIIPSDKDANEMGFKVVNDSIRYSKETTYSDIIKQKLDNL